MVENWKSEGFGMSKQHFTGAYADIYSFSKEGTEPHLLLLDCRSAARKKFIVTAVTVPYYRAGS
uniref:Uncharacterized protein n=1 Tax=Onchocerca volvulus TaxID=6282 RepID=A0A8R1XWK7_ONCVO